MVNAINYNQLGVYSSPEYTYFTPFNFEKPEPILTGGVSKVGDEVAFTTKRDDSKAADGKDDGKIGFFSALGHAIKGGVKFVTGMFTDENGDFSLKQTLKTAAIGLAILGASMIPVVGPFVVPALCAYGMVEGGCRAAKGFVNAMDAKTDAEAEKAWEDVGSGATEGILSYAGYKKSGGFSAAKEKAAARLASSSAKPAETPKLPAEPSVIDVEAVEVEPLQLEAPKTATTTKPTTTEVVKYEPKPTTTDIVKYEPKATTTDIVKYEAKPTTTDIVKYEPKATTTEVAKYDPARAEVAAKEVAAKAQSTTDSFANYIMDKIKNGTTGGIKALTAQEKTQLAKLLDIPESELTSMSRKTCAKLVNKYHPDRPDTGNEKIFDIINRLYSDAETVRKAQKAKATVA